MGEVMENIHAKSKRVFLTTKGCRNSEEDIERTRGAGAAAGFLDEKGVHQCTILSRSFTYTWPIFQQQRHLSKDGCQQAPRVPST